jgi:hypothetical protein
MPDTTDSIASLIRFVADDPEIQFLDTAILLAPINAGYRECQRRLALAGSGLMKQTVILSVPAATTTIPNVALLPPLPDDFIMPYLLWERQAGQTAQIFQPLDEVDHLQPVTPPGPFLRRWTWQGGTINFVAANQDLDLQMEYARYLFPLIAPNQAVEFPWLIDAIVWGTLYMIALQRGAPDAYRDRCSQMCDRFLEETTAFDVKRGQLQRRHRPAHARYIF